jgi:hypothetical protein
MLGHGLIHKHVVKTSVETFVGCLSKIQESFKFTPLSTSSSGGLQLHLRDSSMAHIAWFSSCISGIPAWHILLGSPAASQGFQHGTYCLVTRAAWVMDDRLLPSRDFFAASPGICRHHHVKAYRGTGSCDKKCCLESGLGRRSQ